MTVKSLEPEGNDTSVTSPGAGTSYSGIVYHGFAEITRLPNSFGSL